MKGLFTLDWSNVRSAVVYGVLCLVSIFALSVVQNILNAGTIFGLDWKHILDTSVIATLPLLVSGLSLIKNLLTTSKGKFLGTVDVAP